MLESVDFNRGRRRGSETVLPGVEQGPDPGAGTRLCVPACGVRQRRSPREAGLQTVRVVITLHSCYRQRFYLKSVAGTFRCLIKN